ncbi:hypothetical protein K3G63_22405 [Hymenobacter sp. HSC-4F20]|uniref:hypothetical protein n=1 Tax=Hymenobacter sp. HSC-4F20 TaxID=2864135 RepID=UPI001C72C122|nr:hypothetical protein [Hymenobacter sp. HSC-4F20]MBX0293214.1 hypothetical protein [Hymenobacter sp. HSC-4F20]
MSSKTQEELLQELEMAVRTGGQGGKTTAADVRTFLASLTTELYDRTDGARPFLFQVNALDDPGHFHLASLTVEQVRQLVQQDVDQVTVLSEARDGHQHQITLGYDHAQATFTVLQVRRQGDYPTDAAPEELAAHQVLLIGRGGGSSTGAGDVTKEYVDEQDTDLRNQLSTLQATTTVVNSNFANVVKPDRTTTYYSSAAAALLGASSGDTVNINAPLSDPNVGGNQEQIRVKAGVNVNLHTITVNAPSNVSDVLTFEGGSGVLNGDFATLNQVKSGGWVVGAYANAVVDYTIHNLNINVSGGNGTGFFLWGKATYRYSGTIISSLLTDAIRITGNGQPAEFYGTGFLKQTGPGKVVQVVHSASVFEWKGDIQADDSSFIHTHHAGGKVHLKEGTLYSATRTAGAPPLIAGLGTVTLTNYSVLGTPGQTAVQADTVILRGNTMVRGTIEAKNVIDERAMTSAPGGAGGSTLEFVFEAGFTDDVTRTMGATQAATYQSQQLRNVASVTYRLNGTPIGLPFAVASGDTLEVLISRSAAASTAVVTLAS